MLLQQFANVEGRKGSNLTQHKNVVRLSELQAHRDTLSYYNEYFNQKPIKQTKQRFMMPNPMPSVTIKRLLISLILSFSLVFSKRTQASRFNIPNSLPH